MPRFIPTEDGRAVVMLLIPNGCTQHLVCKCISNRRGAPISESTLKCGFCPRVEGLIRGRVVVDWPGVKETDLYEKRDLKATTDLRAALTSQGLCP